MLNTFLDSRDRPMDKDTFQYAYYVGEINKYTETLCYDEKHSGSESNSEDKVGILNMFDLFLQNCMHVYHPPLFFSNTPFFLSTPHSFSPTPLFFPTPIILLQPPILLLHPHYSSPPPCSSQSFLPNLYILLPTSHTLTGSTQCPKKLVFVMQ